MTEPDERRAAAEAKDEPSAKALRVACSVVMLLGFSATVIAAGHGVLPAGLLLVLGGGDWDSAIALAWVGILILLVGDWVHESKVSATVGLLGVILVTYAWVLFVSESEDLRISLVTGILFPGAALLKLGQIARAFLRPWPRRRTAPGLCARCGYDLRATPRRCPECGTVP